MENLHHEYVYLDGTWVNREKLVQMAIHAGSIVAAEHYMCAYLLNAVINGDKGAIGHLNEVRRAYGMRPIPFTGEEETRSGRVSPKAVMAREKYQGMTVEQREAALREGLKTLHDTRGKLFTSKVDWSGIFLVIRDRLDGKVRKSAFYELTSRIVPQGWPQELMASANTLSNFAHYVGYEDRQEAYYDMEHNPWRDLCNAFWEILEEQILTGN